MPKMTKEALRLARIARRKLYPAPKWGDHVLSGIEGRVVAKPAGR